MKLASNKIQKNQKPAAEKKSAAKTAKRAKKGSSAGKKAAIVLIVIVLAAVAGFFGLGAYANGMEIIYPNVSLEGIDLSGLTITQAADTLSESSFALDENKELSVLLPADVELIVSAKEAGCYLNAPDAAVTIYDFCHDSGFFGNTITYLKCAFGGMRLTVSDFTGLDEDYVLRVVTEAARKVHLALMETSIEIGEDSISVIKGASSAQLDTNELYEAVKQVLQANRYEPMEYNAVAASGSTEELDIQHLYDAIFSEPVNAVYDPDAQAATQSETGRSFDRELAQRLWDEAAVGERVVIPLVITEPEITTEKLNGMLFSEILAQKSTSLGGSSYARVNNITKATAAINGLVLNPGEEFSYNGIVGQRTTAAGYMAAGAYNNGQVVQEVGGGICQVSSTLYYCALHANMNITMRYCHYFGVDYLPAGLDATVSWPAPDFKFKNSSEYPIKIEAYVDKATNSCVVKIHGSNPDGIRVEMTTEALGYADGYGAVSYRWVYAKDGTLISKTKEAESRYYYHTKDDPEPSENPEASPGGDPSAPPSGEPSAPPPSEPPAPSAPVETPFVPPDPDYGISPDGP